MACTNYDGKPNARHYTQNRPVYNLVHNLRHSTRHVGYTRHQPTKLQKQVEINLNFLDILPSSDKKSFNAKLKTSKKSEKNYCFPSQLIGEKTALRIGKTS